MHPCATLANRDFQETCSRELRGALALAIIAVVVVAGVVAALAPATAASWLSGAILLVGCLGVLVANVLTAKRS